MTAIKHPEYRLSQVFTCGPLEFNFYLPGDIEVSLHSGFLAYQGKRLTQVILNTKITPQFFPWSIGKREIHNIHGYICVQV